jgi:pimeloyl-ACP methyl ester carboxylesterase
VLSYQMAYLKAHYPAEFFAGVLSNGGGFYGPMAYLSEARRWGIEVRLPCVNTSEKDYTGKSIEFSTVSPPPGNTPPDFHGSWLRIGLNAVQGLTAHSLQSIMDARSPRVPGFMLDDVIRRAHRGPIARLSQAWAESANYLLDDRLHQVSVPVDLLWGESDRLISLDYARRMEAAIPAVRLTTVPHCGHIPQQEAPEAFRSALTRLLASPPPSAAARAADAGN